MNAARFYKLFKKNKAFPRIVRELREAAEQHRKVRVLLNVPEGDLIKDVEASS